MDGGDAFFADRWPEASAIADPEGRLFDAFGLGRGRLGQLFGPGVWAAGLRAARKGCGIGRPVGDVLRMPGFFLIREDRVVWQHVARHVGDQPDRAVIREAARSARRRAKAG